MIAAEVLVLEPDPVQARAITDSLYRAGYRVTVVPDRGTLWGLAALGAFAGALISYGSFEGEGALSLAEDLRAKYGLPSLLLSTRGTGPPGAGAILRKPYTSLQCRRAVAKLLGARTVADYV